MKAQKKLDDRIVKEKGLQGKCLLDKKILALQVELGELANELPQAFKFWSNKKNNYENALKELVDCLHFILSIGNDLNIKYEEFGRRKTGNVMDLFQQMYWYTVDLSLNRKGLDEEAITYVWEDMMLTFLWIGKELGFTNEQIEQAYFEKNKINHERQDNNY